MLEQTNGGVPTIGIINPELYSRTLELGGLGTAVLALDGLQKLSCELQDPEYIPREVHEEFASCAYGALIHQAEYYCNKAPKLSHRPSATRALGIAGMLCSSAENALGIGDIVRWKDTGKFAYDKDFARNRARADTLLRSSSVVSGPRATNAAATLVELRIRGTPRSASQFVSWAHRLSSINTRLYLSGKPSVPVTIENMKTREAAKRRFLELASTGARYLLLQLDHEVTEWS